MVVRSYQDLLQQPYFYFRSPFTFHPRLAAEIASIVQSETHPYSLFETVMYGPREDYGGGLEDSGVNHGAGLSFTSAADALTKSVFEAFERKFSKVHNPKDLIRGSFRELAHRAVSPEGFSLVSEWESERSKLPYVRYTPDLKLAWKEGFRVHERSLRPVLLPAALVYAQYSWRHPEERFAPNLSPGLACHFNFSSAFLHGLHELIERDAFMITWLRRLSMPRIDPRTVSFDDAEPALEHLHRLGFTVHFINITTDIGVPVVLCLIEHQTLPWDGALIPGLGSDLNPRVALHRAFLEALMLLRNFATIDDERTAVIPGEPDALMQCALPPKEYYAAARFLLNGEPSVSMHDLPNHDRGNPAANLDHLVDHLNHRNLQTYFVDLTPPEYAQDTAFCLTRAFISGVQPMVYEPDCWRLNRERLFKSDSATGSTSSTPDYAGLNLAPHLFMMSP